MPLYEVYVFEKRTNKKLCEFLANYTDNKDAFTQLGFIKEIQNNQTTVILKEISRKEMNDKLDAAYKDCAELKSGLTK